MGHDHTRPRRPDDGSGSGIGARSPGSRSRTVGLSPGRASRPPAADVSVGPQQPGASPAEAPTDPLPGSPPAAAVQRRADAGAVDDPFGFHLAGTKSSEQVHAAAARGLTAPATALPHGDRIQASFGHHDVSVVQAHIGGAAAEASAAMGASAYATGDHVAFATAPDLHTAAHEAAHTVQQRGGVQLLGGVGAAGDAYERHADAVADRVVRGESAEALLGDAPAGGAASGGAVQHQKGVATHGGAKTADEPELVHDDSKPWPVFAKTGLPYIIENRGGKPGFWVARDWIAAEANGRGRVMRAPGRARELLTAMGWVASERMEFAAQSLTFEFHGPLNYFAVGAEAAFATGLPGGRQAIVERHRQLPGGLLVTLSLDDPSIPPDARYQMTTSETARALKAAAEFTGLAIDPAGNAFVMTQWAPPDLTTGNGVVSVDLNRALCRTLFGVAAYNEWLGGPPIKQRAAEEPKTPKLKLDNFYRQPIPGQLTHYGDIVESGEPVRLEVLVAWPHHYPDAEQYEAPAMVTPSKFSNVAALQCTWRFERIAGAPNAAPAVGAAPTAPPATGPTAAPATSTAPPAVDAPATPAGRPAADATPDGANATGDPVAAAGSPTPPTAAQDASTNASPVETQATTVGEAIHRFRLPSGEISGTFRVSCDARFDEYFAPATFTRDVVVLTSAAAMTKLQTASFADLGGPDLDRSRGAWSGDVKPGFRASPAAGSAEAIDDPMARDRAGQRTRLRNVAEYLRNNPVSAEATAALDREIARQEHTEKLLGADRDKGWQTFLVRGTYLSRTEGLASGPLDLHGTVHVEEHHEVLDSDGGNTLTTRSDQHVVRIRDLSRRFEQSDFVFEGRAASFDEALRQAFDDLAVAYPKGLVSIEAEQIDDAALAGGATRPGTGKVVGFQRSTETTWKKVKEVVWDPVASVVVNLGAIALMTLVPGSTIIVAPALTAYNTIPSVDRIATEAARGTLTLGTFAMSTGEIALNLLPLVSSARPLTARWFMVETANWGGQVALMAAGAVDAARQLQANQVAALAVEYEAFLELQKTSRPSDPGLAIAEDQIRRKAAALDGEIGRQFFGQVATNLFQVVAGSVIHNSSLHARAAVIEHLGGLADATSHGDATPAGVGDARPDPTVGPPPGAPADGGADAGRPPEAPGGREAVDISTDGDNAASHAGSDAGAVVAKDKPAADLLQRTAPASWQKFNPDHHAEFQTKLAAFRKSSDLEPTPGLRGGEGQLFLADAAKDRALKRWFQSREGDMAQSIQKLHDAGTVVANSPALSNDLDVVNIYEQGADWVVRDFDPTSVPLKNALGDANVAAARARAIGELEAMPRTATTADLLKKLKKVPPSANVHWSPTKNKMLVIDMQ